MKNVLKAVVLFLSVSVTTTLPVLSNKKNYFPEPTGQYSVGTKTEVWTYTSHSKEAGAKRRLMAQAWYPSSENKPVKPTMPIPPLVFQMWKEELDIPEKELEEALNELGELVKKETDKEAKKDLLETIESLEDYKINRPLLDKALEKLKNIKTYSIENAKLLERDKPFPVIIFSHGFENMRNYSTAHCENLASHGYVVVSVDHTGSCYATQFPEEEPIYSDYKSPANEEDEITEKLKRKDIWVGDIIFTLNMLEEINETSFNNKLDLNRIGAFGHSMGGIAIIDTCRLDKRLKAIAPLDAPIFNSEPIDVPLMMMIGEDHEQMYADDQDNNAIKILCDKVENAEIIEVKDTEHNAFCDQVLIKEVFNEWSKGKPYEHLGTGTIGGFKATSIVNKNLLRFFNKYV